MKTIIHDVCYNICVYCLYNFTVFVKDKEGILIH